MVAILWIKIPMVVTRLQAPGKTEVQYPKVTLIIFLVLLCHYKITNNGRLAGS